MLNFTEFYNISEDVDMSLEVELIPAKDAEEIAKHLGVMFQGYWGDGDYGTYMFTDPLTGGTFTGRNSEQIHHSFERVRRDFGVN